MAVAIPATTRHSQRAASTPIVKVPAELNTMMAQMIEPRNFGLASSSTRICMNERQEPQHRNCKLYHCPTSLWKFGEVRIEKVSCKTA
jgi:hypothetical protein